MVFSTLDHWKRELDFENNSGITRRIDVCELRSDAKLANDETLFLF
jgi:hypothetical protein